jgi:rhodanese-related sulfurtransferase
LVDGEEIPLGQHRLKVWTTPGHTPEHVSYLLAGPNHVPIALFSGGALMVGSAGRTDLLGTEWARPLAVKLYHTLHDRIARLPDSTQVFPTHGGGSFCGRGRDGVLSTTIGEERATNRLLRAPSIDAFLAEILDQRPYPTYFRRMREANLGGVPLRGTTPFELPELDLKSFDAARAAGAQTVDLRPFVEYDAAHVPASYAIDFECGAFSAWAGWLLSPDRPIVFVDGSHGGAATAAARQLFRIGLDRVLGTLRGGIGAWRGSGRPVGSVRRLDSRSLASTLRSDSPLVVVDVRERYEFDTGHIPGAVSLPLGELAARSGELPRNTPVAAYCAHGYRSVTAVSVLEQLGFTDLAHADEGYRGWLEAIRAG